MSRFGPSVSGREFSISKFFVGDFVRKHGDRFDTRRSAFGTSATFRHRSYGEVAFRYDLVRFSSHNGLAPERDRGGGRLPKGLINKLTTELLITLATELLIELATALLIIVATCRFYRWLSDAGEQPGIRKTIRKSSLCACLREFWQTPLD
jgi:hypothetical protein